MISSMLILSVYDIVVVGTNYIIYEHCIHTI